MENRSRHAPRRFLRLLLVLLLCAWQALWAAPPIAAERPNGAGLVVRHGDGHTEMYYVEFTEPEITGLELLIRAGVSLTVAQFGGLGTAVCAIDGEGCPAADCFCRSYSTPAYYWHYYRLAPDGTWQLQPVGPSSRRIRDGDVDGWSWTAGDSGLPSTSIDAIAAQLGVDRASGSAAASSPVPPPSQAQPATPPEALPEPAATTTPTVAASPPPYTPATTVTTPPTHPSPTAVQGAVPTATVASTSSRVPSPPATEQQPQQATAKAVSVTPSPDTASIPAPQAAPSRDEGDMTDLAVFTAMLALVASLIGWLTLRRHPAGGDGS